MDAATGSAMAPAAGGRRRKAAMVVQMLLADGQKLALSRLPEETQLALSRELAGLRLVDRETLHEVAEEFAREIESIGLAAPGDLDGVLATLDGQLSPAALARLRQEAAQARGIDPWARLAALPGPGLAALLNREGVEIAAVALSKLPAARAAEALTLVPGDRARRITYAMRQTAGILPATVARIGRALAADYASDPDPAFPARPEARVGAILNSSRPATRDSVLDSLDRTDADFAGLVRREIFTFANLHERLRAIDIPRAIRGIENAEMTTALAHALARGGEEERAASFILANMSQRLAGALRDAIADHGPIRRRDGEGAQERVLAAIRERVDSGEITLETGEEDGEEG